MKHILTCLLLLGCSDRFTVIVNNEHDNLGGTSNEGGELNLGGTLEESSGGTLSSGGNSSSGGTLSSGGDSSSGGTLGSGGDLSPPYNPTCEKFTCGTLTPQGTDDNIYCYNVQPNNSANGNFNGNGCLITLNGEIFNDFSNGLPAGKLIIWECDFWFNCY